MSVLTGFFVINLLYLIFFVTFLRRTFVNDNLFVSRFFLGFMIQVQKLFPRPRFTTLNAIPSGNNR